MGVLFVVFAFSTLRVSIMRALSAWLICCISIAILMSYLPKSDFGIMTPSRWEAILIWVTFSSLLLRTIGIGYYGTILRKRIHKIGEVIEQASHHDHLTGALNRDTILSSIEDHISLSKLQSIPGCLAAIDIDDLKLINTSVGHSTGDTVLEQTAASIKQHLRRRDRLGRYGSTDFLLLLPATEMSEGLKLVNQIVKEVGDATWYLISAQVQITISCGVTEIRESDSQRNLIERAETALAEAKAKGKNQVVEKVLAKTTQDK
jgi:diguanylate cyclase (GGDEF)-like protein